MKANYGNYGVQRIRRTVLMLASLALATLVSVFSYRALRVSADEGPAGAEQANAKSKPSPEAPGPSRAEQLAYIQSEFESETSDPGWNPSRELRGKVTQILPEGSLIRALDCRHSMCRLETSHGDEHSYQDFTMRFTVPENGQPPWAGPAVFEVERQPVRNGSGLVAVAYLARGKLPELPQN